MCIRDSIGSVYASGFAFHDSAANLLMRLRADAGYRHYFFNVDKHALSGELGAVYTIDNAPFDSIDSNRDGKVSVWGDETRFEDSGGVFGARLALAYSNEMCIRDSVGLPGFWPHTALWVGSPAELTAYFADPEVEAAFGGSFSEHLQRRYPQALSLIHIYSQRGELHLHASGLSLQL